MGSTQAATKNGKRVLPTGTNIRSNGCVDLASPPQSQVNKAAQRYAGIQTIPDRSTADVGLDSAGLAQLICRRLGISIPRTVEEQHRAAYDVPSGQYRAGDLVFLKGAGYRKGITHVGVYLGNRKFIHASQGSNTAIVDSLDTPYNMEHLYGIGRPMTPNMQKSRAIGERIAQQDRHDMPILPRLFADIDASQALRAEQAANDRVHCHRRKDPLFVAFSDLPHSRKIKLMELADTKARTDGEYTPGKAIPYLNLSNMKREVQFMDAYNREGMKFAEPSSREDLIAMLPSVLGPMVSLSAAEGGALSGIGTRFPSVAKYAGPIGEWIARRPVAKATLAVGKKALGTYGTAVAGDTIDTFARGGDWSDVKASLSNRAKSLPFDMAAGYIVPRAGRLVPAGIRDRIRVSEGRLGASNPDLWAHLMGLKGGAENCAESFVADGSKTACTGGDMSAVPGRQLEGIKGTFTAGLAKHLVHTAGNRRYLPGYSLDPHVNQSYYVRSLGKSVTVRSVKRHGKQQVTFEGRTGSPENMSMKRWMGLEKVLESPLPPNRPRPRR